MKQSKLLQQLLGYTASRLYQEVNANQIVIVEDRDLTNFEKQNDKVEKLKITILDKKEQKERYFVMENEENKKFNDKIKSIIIRCIKNNLVQKNSKLVFVFDSSLSEEFPLGMIVLEVSRVLYRIAKFRLAEHMEEEKVLEKLINISEEIQIEGREGKNIGTLFVIGNPEEIQPYTKQLILNPFQGYPSEMLNIIENDLTETIKEFAQLDGGFIIDNKGQLVSAGTYININTSEIEHKYKGWGTKHLAAVGITQKTNAIAIIISESGQKIKIFKKGKLILKI